MGGLTTHDPFGLTDLAYDDVLPLSELTDVVPSSVDTSSRLMENTSLRIPLLSVAMDMVIEARVAITMVRQDGIGTLHRSLSIEEQAVQVHQVKYSEFDMVEDLVTVGPDATIGELDNLCSHYCVSSLPIVNEGSTLLGIITNHDLRFVPQDEWTTLHVRDCMTPHDRLVVGQVGISHEHAKHLLVGRRVEKLPIVNDNDHLAGLITVKDFIKTEQYPNAVKDSRDRLVVGTAAGYQGDAWERTTALAEAGVNILVVDTANGGARLILDMIRRIKADPTFEDIDIIGGNIATTEGAQALIDTGVDVVRVGVDPGSICATRAVAGAGAPQVTAIHLAAKAYNPAGVPLIADGGLQYSGGIGKALAAGAGTAMLDSLLASCEESPGEVVSANDKQFKCYRGIGSLGVMSSHGRKSYSRGRYFQTDVTSDDKIVPEGIEGQVPYTGSLAQVICQFVGDLHQTMFYPGASTIPQVKANGRFVCITSAGLRESHPRNVQMTTETPNYHSSSAKQSQAGCL